MKQEAYYNENDPFAARWLRNLADADRIPRGVVDDRSIKEIVPDDVRDYRECHFFAGIGGWPLALSRAGWPAGRRIWTGSPPCQPYSSAGKNAGDADPRNLWPAFFGLIRECRPECVIGEQVDSAIGHGWLDGICADLEGEGYAVGAVVLGAHSEGAPHIRQRLFWVADARRPVHERRVRPGEAPGEDGPAQGEAQQREWGGPDPGRGGLDGRLGDPGGEGLARRPCQSGDDGPELATAQRAGRHAGGVADLCGDGRQQGARESSREEPDPAGGGPGFWSDFDVIPCRDGKARRVEPGAFPLAHGFPAGLDRVRTKCLGDSIREVKKYAQSSGVSPEQAVRMVRHFHESEAIPAKECPGMPVELPPKAFLLDFLLHVLPAHHRTAVSRGFPEEGEEAAEGGVRSLRIGDGMRHPSSRREPHEQFTGQFPDALRSLSWVLARNAQALWSKTIGTDAELVPLSQWNVNRVGLLRGYGNAIVVPVAAEFVRAYLDATD